MRQTTGRPFPVLHRVPPEGRGPGQAEGRRESRPSDPARAFFPHEEPKFSSAPHVCQGLECARLPRIVYGSPNPSTTERDLSWRQGLYRSNHVSEGVRMVSSDERDI